MSIDKKLFAVLGVLGICAAAGATAADTVTLYSARQEALIKPLLDRFTEKTGISVNLLTGDADVLLKRLVAEGANTPADLLLTTDAGRLHRAKAEGVTEAFVTDTLRTAVPAAYRDPDGHWAGLSLRARPILYAKGAVDPKDLSTYEDLADPKWKGKICIRSSDNIYNQSLVSSLIAANGIEATETWATGLVANFARPPKGGDRDQIAAAAAGQCALAVANTYYLAGMLTSGGAAQKAAAEKVAVFWPNQNGRGAHVNVSGAAMVKGARHPEAAARLVEFLAGPESQAWYAETNGEYPVRPDVAWSPLLQSWGTFTADTLNLGRLGELNGDAVMLMDRAGWR